MVIVQINYRRPDMPSEAWAKRYTDDIATPFVDMQGLKWKIWIDEPGQQLSGGIYLPFEIYEIARHITLVRVSLFALNVAMVAYLARLLWLRRYV